jgi:hypothetical protein
LGLKRLLKKSLPRRGAASQAAEKSRLAQGHGFTGCGKNPVLLKGTASAVPQVFYLQWGFSPCGTHFVSEGTFSAACSAAP